ncbi:hypothetical protein ACGF8B_41850 [Streptomyces sp. NPDC047917]|uniref:hypothetical protein n=1 Tax=Streptomyces sp. NPDC047917 TaxID=3365491 RepID=UPI0037189EB7
MEGGDVVDELLGDYRTAGFERIQQAVRLVLAHHRADAGPHADRGTTLRCTAVPLYMEY